MRTRKERFLLFITRWEGTFQLILTISALVTALFLFCETQKQVKVAKRALKQSEITDSTANTFTRYIVDSTAKANYIRDTITARTSQDRYDSTWRESKRLVEVNERAMKTANRAYVAIRNFFITQSKEFDTTTFIIQFENVGKSVAYNYGYKTKMYYTGVNDTATDEGIRKIIESIIPDIQGSLAPTGQGAFPTNVTMKYNMSIDTMLINYNLRLFFYGKVVYDDVFSAPHYQNFCVEYSPYGRIKKFIARHGCNDADH